MFRIPYLLFVKTLAFAMGPLYFLWKPLTSLLLWGGLIYLIYSLVVSDEEVNVYVPQDQGAALVQQDVKHIEDGNSRFAKDMVTRMSQPQQQYYWQVFSYAVSQVPIDTPYLWQYQNIGGSIAFSGDFKNSRGEKCRNFKESIKVATRQQNLDGKACFDSHSNRWCKLKLNDTATCRIQAEEGWDKSIRELKNMF